MLLDREFFLHDIEASKAHVEGLLRINLLTDEESQSLVRELDVLAADFSAGTFVLDVRFEDGHSAIEARLIDRLGALGGKVHTGRSRNDQILVAVQVETAEGLANTAKIAAADGVDLVFVGPGDLSVSIDAMGPKGADKLGKAIEKIIKATLKAGKIAGISGPVDLNLSCSYPGSTPSTAKGSRCAKTRAVTTTTS